MFTKLWQSQPASATLRNIFEKDLSRSQEIEFFSRSGINFLPRSYGFSFCNRTDVGSFRIYCRISLLPFSMASFLPCAIGIGKIHGHVELLGYPFMLGELTAVVRGDGLQGLSLYGSSNLHTVLATGFAFFPCLSLSINRKFVLLSVSVRMALLSLSTMRSISQSPKRLPSASAGRSCMLTRLRMFVALVS